MPGSTYPALSANPAYPVAIDDDDAQVVRSDKAAGYQHTRPRYTRNRKTFHLSYPHMTLADLGLLLAFYDSVRGADAFWWADPDEAKEPSLAWCADHPYLAGEICRPTGMNGHSYRAVTGGTSDDTTEPIWPTTEAATVAEASPSTLVWAENSRIVTFAGPIKKSHTRPGLAQADVVLQEV
jgi:hypothetical protein